VHADIKPENVFMVSTDECDAGDYQAGIESVWGGLLPASMHVVLGDFGNALHKCFN
jgi:serine/threonine protein kinase